MLSTVLDDMHMNCGMDVDITYTKDGPGRHGVATLTDVTCPCSALFTAGLHWNVAFNHSILYITGGLLFRIRIYLGTEYPHRT